jgi:hypothetical protein
VPLTGGLRAWRRRRELCSRLAVQMLLVQNAERGEPWTHGIDLWLALGGSSGRVYLALAELELAGEVISRWVEGPYPRRRQYMIRDGYARAPKSEIN